MVSLRQTIKIPTAAVPPISAITNGGSRDERSPTNMFGFYLNDLSEQIFRPFYLFPFKVQPFFLIFGNLNSFYIYNKRNSTYGDLKLVFVYSRPSLFRNDSLSSTWRSRGLLALRQLTVADLCRKSEKGNNPKPKRKTRRET